MNSDTRAPWINRLKDGGSIHLVKENEDAKVIMQWQSPPIDSRPKDRWHDMGRICFQKQDHSIHVWAVDLYGNGYDHAPLIQPNEGSLASSEEELVSLNYNKVKTLLYRQYELIQALCMHVSSLEAKYEQGSATLMEMDERNNMTADLAMLLWEDMHPGKKFPGFVSMVTEFMIRGNARKEKAPEVDAHDTMELPQVNPAETGVDVGAKANTLIGGGPRPAKEKEPTATADGDAVTATRTGSRMDRRPQATSQR